jgi:hypothetical protein
LVIEIIAVTCQFVQTTDQRFPLVYFTVDSAVFAGAAAAITMARPQFRYLIALRITSAVGVVIAALVFAIVIAPATPTGTWIQPHDDVWVRTANILLHGVAPLLVCVGVPGAGLAAYLRYAYVWPLAYLVTIAALTCHGLAMPYPFLSPAYSGWPRVLAAMAILAALNAGVSAALFGITRLLRAHRTIV